MNTRSIRCGLLLVVSLMMACAPSNPDGAGSLASRVDPASYTCDQQEGQARVGSAGVVEGRVESCDDWLNPRPRQPQMLAPAARQPTMAHRWWGTVTFFGEHRVDDPDGLGYITPDPLTARVSERGLRVMGIPAGLQARDKGYTYPIPEPLKEVYDGIALANSQFADMSAYVRDYSDGSVTIEWRSGHRPVMAATLVQGSPYLYISVYRGELLLRTRDADGEHKGVFHQQGNSLGIWTQLEGERNHFLLTGHDAVQFRDPHSREITARGRNRHYTLTWLPSFDAPSDRMISEFERHATKPVDEVRIDYQVDPDDYSVTIDHEYRHQGEPVTTLAGLQPLHWKNSEQALTDYRVRGPRGVTRFARTQGFSYTLPSVGVLPAFPGGLGDTDPDPLRSLVEDFLAKGESEWNRATDTYFAGKNYGKVAELAAIARAEGMEAEADRLLAWLKSELEQWFGGQARDGAQYFAYDPRWHTVLGVHESFGAHQDLNDHHFHYGYFVRAAAEICRVDSAWCTSDQWGPMVELLIRDYAAGRDDPRFPYLRHFDPAFGFSWASGSANYLLGNNNESTSEAANAYGAMILYGLVTDQPDLVDRGVYLHASTAASFWEYWNDLDGYRQKPDIYRNFPESYDPLTTSIVWGSGHEFTTWFSEAYAHILGIQGLPLNPLVLHLGLYPDYLADYVALGLEESANGLPSGLPDGHWRDIWWNIWAMTDPEAAEADMAEYGFDYPAEEGETHAHTYHWVQTFKALGQVNGELSADYPAAVAFDGPQGRTYIAYNFGAEPRVVTFSDGTRLEVAPGAFGTR